MKKPTTPTKEHIPVLLNEVLGVLDPKKGEEYLDLTAGYGGHAQAIIDTTDSVAVLVDRDRNAIAELERTFSDRKVEIIHSDFLSAGKRLADEGRRFDLILADLGVSSPHLDNPSRGFSLKEDGPLDMRMDESGGMTAAELVNNAAESEIIRILRDFGEEPKARHIARLIVDNRPIATTKQLAQIVARAWPGHSRVHPATRTFQALRIAVNDELTQIKEALPVMERLLKPGGRMAVISFHSLEDKIVKDYFSEHGGERYDASLQILTKKPLQASETELAFNQRARSARLRASQRK